MNNRSFLLIIAGIALLGAVACVDPFNPRETVPPVIKNELEGARYYPGDVAEALVVDAVAADGGVLSYQWHSNVDNAVVGGRAIIGATGTSFTPPLDKLGTVYYYVRVTNTHGGKASVPVFSNVVEIELTNILFASKPRIPMQPRGATYQTSDIPEPLSVTVTVAGAGAGELSYQWYWTDDPEAEGEAIEGATDAEYIPSTAEESITYFYVIITNEIPDNGDGGDKIVSVKSNVVRIEVSDREHAHRPRIADEDQPQSGTFVINTPPEPREITATVEDGGTLTYQWYRNTINSSDNGTPIPRATSASYTPPVNTLGIMYYYVIITNRIADNGDGGEKTAVQVSAVFSIEVVPPPTLGGVANITGENNLNGYRIGETLTVHTDALTGAEGLTSSYTYRWRANGANIPGATDAEYIVDGQCAGKAISCEIRYPGVQGAIIANGLTVFYNIVIQTEGDVAGDSVMINPPYGHAGDTITLYYTVTDTSSVEVENVTDGLDFEGLGQRIESVETAGTGTGTYTVRASDATEDGEIIIIAIFIHDSRVRDPIEFVDESGHINIVYGQTGFSNIIVDNFNSVNRTIRYESSRPEVATVNGGNGIITTLAQGNTVITAYKTGDSTYADTRRSYTLEVDHRPVQIIGVVANDKRYDGNDEASFSTAGWSLAAVGGITESGPLFGDNVNPARTSAFAKFDTKNAGVGKTVTFDDFSLTGAKADNYRVVQPADGTADITPRPVTITVTLAETREYNGNTNVLPAMILGASIGAVGGQSATTGIVPGSSDEVSAVPGVATLGGVDVGAQTVTFSGWTLGGADAGNYELYDQPANVTVEIIPAVIPLDLLSVSNKEFSPITTGATLTFDKDPGNLTVDKEGFTYTGGGVTGTLTYDGSTVYETPSVTLTLTPPAGNNSSFAPIVISGVTVHDGLVRTAAGAGDRRIPIREANFTEFNWYVFTPDGRGRHFRLAEDITLTAPTTETNPANWTAGMTWNANWKTVTTNSSEPQFIGSLDGQSHFIKNLAPWPSNSGNGADYASMTYFTDTISASNAFAGLFHVIGGAAGESGIVENLKLDTFYGYDKDKGIAIGGIANQLRTSSIIRNCQVTGAIKSNASTGVGGIVRLIDNGRIETCTFTGGLQSLYAVSGQFSYAGGIVGNLSNSTYSEVIGCTVNVNSAWSTSNATGYVGGIVGINGVNANGYYNYAGTITGCTVNVSSTLGNGIGYVGGIVGQNFPYLAAGDLSNANGAGGVINECIVNIASTGVVNGGTKAGGIVGMGGRDWNNWAPAGKITGCKVFISGTLKNSSNTPYTTQASPGHVGGIVGLVGTPQSGAVRLNPISGCEVTIESTGILEGLGPAGGIVGNLTFSGATGAGTTVDNCTVTIKGILRGTTHVGGIVGQVDSSQDVIPAISGCTVTITGTLQGGTTANGDSTAGGIVGYVSQYTTTVRDCHVTTSGSGQIKAAAVYNSGGGVNGRFGTGGIVGYSSGNTTIECSFKGTIVGIGSIVAGDEKLSYNIGGIAGQNRGGIIQDCWAEVDISDVVLIRTSVYFTGGLPSAFYENTQTTGYGGAGGIAGFNSGTITGTHADKSKSYVTGTISGAGCNIGGIAGTSYAGVIENYSFGGTITVDATAATDGNFTGGIAGLARSSGRGAVSDGLYTAPGRITGCTFNGTVSGARYVGGIAGYTLQGHVIQRCSSSGTVKSDKGININTGGELGGIAGILTGNNTSVWDCFSDATIISNINDTYKSPIDGGSNRNTAKVGGIAGSVQYGEILRCHFDGDIDAPDSATVGGIVGSLSGDSIIMRHCYNTGTVSGWVGVGGIAGYLDYSDVQNCYNAGAVSSATGNVGGIVGDINSSWGSNLLKNTVALGATTAEGSDIILENYIVSDTVGRVAGTVGTGVSAGTYADNYASGAVTVYAGPATTVSNAAGKDGETITSIQRDSAAWWQGLGFTAANGWTVTDGELPTLTWEQ